MAISFSRPDPSSPAAVSEASFSTGRRGFDQQEVREFLRMVAAELARLQERERFLERELREVQQRSPSDAMIDDDTVTQLLGEEATRILHAARESATAIRSKAEEGAGRLLRESSEEAQRQREEADLEAARRRSDAAADAEAEMAMARQQGREMVEEARSYRERVLGELSRRRELARQQLEHLIHGRERLLQAFERARLLAVDVVAEMTPIGEPDEYVDLSPTTGPVPIMVPTSSVADASAIDESVLRPRPDQADAAQSDDALEGNVDAVVIPFESGLAGDDDAPTVYDAAEEVSEIVELVDVSAIEVADDEIEIEPAAEIDELDEFDDDDDDATASDVADLFARLRANPPPPNQDDTELDVDVDAAGGDAELDEDPGEEPEEETPFRQRDAVLVPLIVSGARKLKRVLADEQNEVLDRLRQRQPVTDLDDLAPDAEAQSIKYFDAVADELRAAAAAGAASLGGSLGSNLSDGSDGGDANDAGSLIDVRAALVELLVEPLRERLRGSVAAGEGDNDVVTKRVRPVYREWKTKRIDEQLDDLFRSAYVAGAVASAVAATPVLWHVDPDGPPSPDCEDNALAGAVALGDPFPSGHQWPPMHPGCRCLLILTDG